MDNKTLNTISDFIFTSKYSRYLPSKQRRETWEEAVKRVETMHLKKYSFLSNEDKEEIQWAFDMVREKRIVPSMRSMQFGGKAIEMGNARQFNCSVIHISNLRAFAEVFYLLLCGCGVGIGLTYKFLNRLPNLVGAKDKTGTVVTYVIEDTIEGWADSVQALLQCYFKNNAHSGRKIVFDFSKIRPAGAPLKTSGGKAPGYLGLKNALLKIKALLDHIIEQNKQTRLRTVDAYDILMHTSDAVLSGGVRRSATSVVFDKDDSDMLHAKTYQLVDRVYKFHPTDKIKKGNIEIQLFEGKIIYQGKKIELSIEEWEVEKLEKEKLVNWWHVHPQRARSNNSVLLLRNEVSKDEFAKIVERTKEFGEPGFCFADDPSVLFNPCASIDTKILTTDGWREFGELLGKEIDIIQDNRVQGYEKNGKEYWDIDLNQIGTSVNKATNIRKTGENKDVYEITSACGRVVKTTGDHLFATKHGMIEAKHLKEKDKILVALPEVFIPEKNSVDFKTGFIAGLIYGDGCVSGNDALVDLWEPPDKNNFDTVQSLIHELVESDLVNKKTYKRLPKFNVCCKTPKYIKCRLSSTSLKKNLDKYEFTKENLKWLHSKSKNFKAGFLSGEFYTDGHVDFNNKSKSISLRIGSIKFNDLQDLQLVLQELGIFSRIHDLLPDRMTLLPDGRGGQKEYHCQRSYRLIVASINNSENFRNIIGHIYCRKIEKFDKIVKTRVRRNQPKNYYAKVKSVKYAGKEDVYCLSENNRRTLIANGLTARRCFEILMRPITKDGVCGVNFCNLTSINGAKVTDEVKFAEAAEASAIIGTLQAGYTDFPYLSNASKEITEDEALLGCSITGMMDNPDILLNPKLQKKMAKLIVETNKIWARKIGINQAARTTTLKPEGTSSLLLNSASGIHPHHARKYFRRVQVNKLDNVYQFFKLYNDHACEESVWSANKTDDVITFPIEVSEKAMIKSDLTALQHLEIIKNTQINWVMTGTTEANKINAHHNVSCTVIVKENEWDDVINYIYDNREYFTAVSLLPATGDKIYPQAPMEAVVTPEDEQRWNDLMSKMVEVDYKKLKEEEDNTSSIQEAACAGGQCEVIK